MGEVVKGKCNCGFESESFAVGVGRMSKFSKEIAICHICNIMRNAESGNDVDWLCKNCSQQMYPLHFLCNPDKNYYCLNCKCVEMKFQTVMMWD